ncbi:carbohydrate ABC transporter substrate-binding protein [Butyrivibrio sp. VCD2006]|uniref:carbohydrate ABC transporter substrate-binding protein n=1 Tax=Butyrivibrio sp. VCD2006 TaxID=1280664 RepID=UPI000421A135|nr:carbohydrate ABC transporter substrate-binding protein [Butyrivibrio sp. VCD2006]
MTMKNNTCFSIAILCLMAVLISGCAQAEQTAETEAETTATSELCSDGGQVLNIYCWNTEFEERMTAFYPGYTDNGDGTGSIGNVKVVWTITPSDNYGYQNLLDEELLVNMDKKADDRIDLFLMEADYILKYADSDYTLDIVNDLGITESELADQYQYTKDIATSRDGKLKGSSWQAAPGLFGYRRSIARDVLGTDDPDEVQKYLSDWKGFDNVAEQAAAKGYMMLSSIEDCYKIFANNAKVKWVDDPFSSTPKIQIDSKQWEWVDMCKKYRENGWINDTTQWSEGWNFDQSAEGKVFGFFMSTWGINFTLVGNAGEEGFGDWSICEGPAAWYWGGTWIAGARGTDNASLVADIMRKLTCDKQNMVKITEETQDYTNTISGMQSLASSDYHSDFLNGQNHIKMFAQAAPKIDMSLAGPYDQGLGDTFREAFKPYINGECDKQAALNEFYKQAVVKYPELTFDAEDMK